MNKRFAIFVVLLMGLSGGCVSSGGGTAPALPVDETAAAPVGEPATPAAVPLPTDSPVAQATPEATAVRSTPEGPMPPQVVCEATPPDMLGPFYTPGAPQRASVGQGYVLSGVVRSLEGCQPLPGVLLEFWMAGPDGQYTDDYRASLVTDSEGRYRFESHVPVPYGGRPPHIHIRISAPGHTSLVTQHYPASGQTEAIFDLVLIPGE